MTVRSYIMSYLSSAIDITIKRWHEGSFMVIWIFEYTDCDVFMQGYTK